MSSTLKVYNALPELALHPLHLYLYEMTLKVYFYRRYTSCILMFLIHLGILRNAVLLQVWPGIHFSYHWDPEMTRKNSAVSTWA